MTAPDGIYRKTEEGRREVDTRAHGLSSRLRRVLILVDGQRTLAEIGASLGGENALVIGAELLRRGLIEARLPTAPGRPRIGDELERIKTQLADKIRADLGADGGDLITQLSACGNRSEVRAHIQHVCNYYENSVSEQRAETLWLQAQVLLDQDDGV